METQKPTWRELILSCGVLALVTAFFGSLLVVAAAILILQS
jgi:hypothetical protein